MRLPVSPRPRTEAFIARPDSVAKVSALSESLGRHVSWKGEGENAEWTISAFPTDDPSEIDETLELACSVMLGVTVAVNEAVGGTETGERLFKLLSNANKAARDNQAA